MCKNDSLLSVGLLFMRVSFGCMMLVHGLDKLMNFAAKADNFLDPLGMGSQLSLVSAIGAEVGCSILLILGLATRWAAIPLAFTMTIALFMVHAGDPWKAKELAAVYLAVYIVLLLTGAGRFSLDRLLQSKQCATPETAPD